MCYYLFELIFKKKSVRYVYLKKIVFMYSFLICNTSIYFYLPFQLLD